MFSGIFVAQMNLVNKEVDGIVTLLLSTLIICANDSRLNFTIGNKDLFLRLIRLHTRAKVVQGFSGQEFHV